MEATHQTEHKDARYFWIPEQVQDEDFSVKKRIAQTLLERGQSLLQYCKVVQVARLVFYEAMDPTLHEVYDGFGGTFATPIKTNRNLMRADDGCGGETADSETRTQKLKQTIVNVDHEHRDGCTN